MAVAPKLLAVVARKNVAARNATRTLGERAPRITRRNAPMKYQRIGLPIAVAAAVMSATAFAPTAHAIDITAGDWTVSIDGNVNAHYIYSRCQQHAVVISGGLACTDDDPSSSSVSNGLLPAALSISGATTQSGYDIGFTFGLYPGISTINGGSPNLGVAPTANQHTALGTAGLDIRQVFLTFGNKDMGTVLAGRNIGLFGGDAILNDMTLLGVGAGNGNYAAPANTSLGSIGLGYIYTDWLAQIDYTTPDISGAKFTVGVFDPLNTLNEIPVSKKAPGIQTKAAYTWGSLYLSATGLYQQQRNITLPGNQGNYNSYAFDAGGKYDWEALEVLGWYYRGWGVGTTGLFINSDDGLGHRRDSEGFLAQVTYKIVATKIGVNYGLSKLYHASGESFPTLVAKNNKVTVGVYQDLTKNLLLLAEFSRLESQNQAGGENKSLNINVGAFLKF
jgi:predicted porin